MKLIAPHFAKFLTGFALEYAYAIITLYRERRPPLAPSAVAASPDLQVDELQAAALALNENFKIEQANALSGELMTVDMERDRLIVGLHTMLEGFTYHFDPAKASAASLLLAAIDKYGARISKLHYEIETTTINSLLNDFTNDAQLTSALSVLGLEAWVVQMRTANERFRQIYSSRIGQKTDTVRTPTVELRQNLLNALRNLFAHLTAHATLNNDATVELIISDINQLTTRYNQIANQRLSRLQDTAELPSVDSYTGV